MGRSAWRDNICTCCLLRGWTVTTVDLWAGRACAQGGETTSPVEAAEEVRDDGCGDTPTERIRGLRNQDGHSQVPLVAGEPGMCARRIAGAVLGCPGLAVDDRDGYRRGGPQSAHRRPPAPLGWPGGGVGGGGRSCRLSEGARAPWHLARQPAPRWSSSPPRVGTAGSPGLRTATRRTSCGSGPRRRPPVSHRAAAARPRERERYVPRSIRPPWRRKTNYNTCVIVRRPLVSLARSVPPRS
jgi:hypothetical protein